MKTSEFLVASKLGAALVAGTQAAILQAPAQPLIPPRPEILRVSATADEVHQALLSSGIQPHQAADPARLEEAVTRISQAQPRSLQVSGWVVIAERLLVPEEGLSFRLSSQRG